jgi:hypothetical protein
MKEHSDRLFHLWHNRFLPYLRVHAKPLVIITLIWIILYIANIPERNARLIGWDNLLTELNRAFFGVWQEHQGLGHIGGHGYATSIIHALQIGILSIAVPQQFIRYTYISLCLLSGGLGAYFLSYIALPTNNIRAKKIGSAIAGCFYMLNLGTIQNFYIPFEAFTVHFATLPWLIISLVRYLQKPSRLWFMAFLAINIAAIPLGFVPPLFIVTTLWLIGIAGMYLISHHNWSMLKRITLLFFAYVCIHAFWLLPVVHYSLTDSQEYLSSYGNLTSTGDFILQNKAYGTLANVSLLKGFYFESLDSDTIGESYKILAPWISHLQKPGIIPIGYLFFLLSVLGAVLSFRNIRKSPLLAGLLVLSLLSFTAMATNTVPFANISNFIQQSVPLLKQAFRIAFTKFSISLALSYSIFLALSVSSFTAFLMVHFKKRTTAFVPFLPPVILFILILIFSFPALSGHLFYKKAKLEMPTGYTKLMTWFGNQDPNERVALFPQGWRTGWEIYNWGYSGTGFLFYSLPQPITERAFDVWSKYNETYYWQISDALFRNDYTSLNHLLNLYQIRYLVYDPNLKPFASAKEQVILENLLSYLTTSEGIIRRTTFSSPENTRVRPISVFERNIENPDKNHIMIVDTPPNILPAVSYTDRDMLNTSGLTYRTDPAKDADIVLPFRSLFNGRGMLDTDVTISDTGDSFTFSKEVKSVNDVRLVLPAYQDMERYIPAEVVVIVGQKNTTVAVRSALPHLYIDNKNIGYINQEKTVFSIPIAQQEPVTLMINGVDRQLPVDLKKSQTQVITLFATGENSLTFSGAKKAYRTTFTFTPVSQTAQNIVLSGNTSHLIEIRVPKSMFPYGYDSAVEQSFRDSAANGCSQYQATQRTWIPDALPYWRMTAGKSDTSCMAFYFPNLSHDTGYLIRTTSKHITGRPFEFILHNLTTDRTDLQFLLPDASDWRESYTIQPPQLADGLGYTVKLLNTSIASLVSTNDLAAVSIVPIPYGYIKSIQLRGTDSGLTFASDSADITIMTPKQTSSYGYAVSHPNPSYYRIDMEPSSVQKDSKTLILNQSFNPGWHAYMIPENDAITALFPFIIGRELPNHVIINNWANGWEIPPGTSTIVIFFLPQLLEWIGFILLPIPFLFLIKKYTNKY